MSMPAGQMLRIDKVEELFGLFDAREEITLYGAGHYLHVVLSELKSLAPRYLSKIKCILVSRTQGNPKEVRGIAVRLYQDADLGPKDCVLLTLGLRYANEVYRFLKDTGACIVCMDFNLFHEKPYRDVKRSIQPFLDGFSGNVSWNEPQREGGTTAWTCWWQGEAGAPGIVKACLASQRRNLPEGVRQVVVTAENYADYICLPGQVLEKVADGRISLTTLSDLLRAALLYKYGGFWMDATLYVCRPLGEEILKYPVYTRNLAETQYCADAMWSGWFFYAKPGNLLFGFLMESLFYYFSAHDRIQYYFMIDYLIAIACNTFPEVERQLKAVPYNNEGAQELARHLLEPYEEGRMEAYTKDTSVQKLTYKLSFDKGGGGSPTIYEYIEEQGKEEGKWRGTDQ